MGVISLGVDVNKDTSYLSINAKTLGTISARMLQGELITLSSAIKSEFIYKLSIFLHVRLELGFNSVITRYVLLHMT